MTSTAPNLHDIAAEWRAARRVYSIYAPLLKRFELGVKPCRVLESPVDRSDAESLASMREWLEEMDAKCGASHLRQVLQALPIGTEPVLRALTQRYLAKDDGLDAYRDKVDFLLVQYFCQFAPAEMHERHPKLDDMAIVLEPVIGEASLRVPGWAAQVELLLVRLVQCHSLADLAREGILEQGRALKEKAGAMYFGSGVMLAFARYNFMLRRAFARLMRADLEHIRATLNALEHRGVTTLDCSRAGLGSEECLASIRRECRDWKKIYLADYAAGGAFSLLIALRESADLALANAPEPPKAVEVLEPAVTAAPVALETAVAAETPNSQVPREAVTNEAPPHISKSPVVAAEIFEAHPLPEPARVADPEIPETKIPEPEISRAVAVETRPPERPPQAALNPVAPKNVPPQASIEKIFAQVETTKPAMPMAKPVEIAKPVEVPKPVEVAKPVALATPVEVSKPLRPESPGVTTTPVETPKPLSVPKPVDTAPPLQIAKPIAEPPKRANEPAMPAAATVATGSQSPQTEISRLAVAPGPIQNKPPNVPKPVPVVETPMPASLPELASALVVSGATDVTYPLQDALERIAEQLFFAESQNVHLAVATVTLGGTRILLSSWEVAAFLRGGDDVADMLQRAVAVRAVVVEALERLRRTGAAPDLKAALGVAHVEAAALQESIAQARDRKNVDAAVNLAATAKRLLTFMDEAETCLSEQRMRETKR
ncbi:MAG TPA: hypothetical protein VN622_06830 [Clostridia bacterium]|nr:hypothetical protein [Clostridia bacterium]